MHPHDELEWLAARRADAGRPSETSTGTARASLLSHARTRQRRRRATQALAGGGALAAAAAVTAVLAGTGPAGAPARLDVAPATQPAAAGPHTPLTRLAAEVRLMPSPRQRGDATLVVRDTRVDGRHVTSGGLVYGGYDLYTDSGHYYYAPDSLAQLQQTVDSGAAVGDDGNQAHVLAVLARHAGATPAVLRRVLLNAEPHPSRADVRAEERHMSAAQRRRIAHQSAAQRRLLSDSGVYIWATQTLQIGAGRSLVRAAAMKIRSTLRGISEREVRIDGIRALRVDYPATLRGPGTPATSEVIWLDAQTGVPIQERDGSMSATRYIVKRVNAAHLPTRVSTRDELR